MNKALKIKITGFLSRTKAIKLHDWYVNKMPDWWRYKAIRSGEEGEDVEYIELNYQIFLHSNFHKNNFEYKYNIDLLFLIKEIISLPSLFKCLFL